MVLLILKCTFAPLPSLGKGRKSACVPVFYTYCYTVYTVISLTTVVDNPRTVRAINSNELCV